MALLTSPGFLLRAIVSRSIMDAHSGLELGKSSADSKRR
jgi:hypothetical protein